MSGEAQVKITLDQLKEAGFEYFKGDPLDPWQMKFYRTSRGQTVELILAVTTANNTPQFCLIFPTGDRLFLNIRSLSDITTAKRMVGFFEEV